MTERPAPEVLISQEEIAERVEALAQAIAPRIDNDTVVVCLLTGGLWFAADLTRALWTRRALRRPVAGLLS
jgi:hypoxanthine phosphoribosyltransferase